MRLSCYVIKYKKQFMAEQCTIKTNLTFCDRFSTKSEALEHLFFFKNPNSDDFWEYEVIKIGETDYLDNGFVVCEMGK